MEQTERLHREDEETFRFSVRELAAPLFRRKKVLLATFLTLIVLAAIVAALFPAPYKAHMSVLVRRDRLNPLVTTEQTTQVLNGTQPVSEEETNSEMELLKSRDVLQKVVEAAGLDKEKGPSWMGDISTQLAKMVDGSQLQADRRERAVRELAKKLKVETGTTKSNLINVSYEARDPQQAYAVMNALASFYMAKQMEVNNPYGSSKFFAGEMNKYKQALDSSEQKLQGFSSTQGLSAPDVERTDLAQQVTNAIGQLQTNEEQAAADAAHIRTDEQQLQSLPERSTTLKQSQPADKLLEDLNEQLVTAEAKRADLAMKYAPQYPLVKEADKELSQIRSAITAAKSTTFVSATTDKDATYELIREDLAKTRADAAAQHASIAALRRGIRDLQGQMVSLDQKALQEHDLQRAMNVNEQNYLLYQSKWQQAQASDALDKTRIGNVAIADPPSVPALPIYSLSMFLAMAFACSLLLGLIAAYVVDYLDPSFHTPKQVADVLEIPVVIAVGKRA
ncbi:MAG TPA: GumC family protein [Terracidiphilus sp.]|nr:GumC family protein [Terracidiphilus sp.]